MAYFDMAGLGPLSNEEVQRLMDEERKRKGMASLQSLFPGEVQNPGDIIGQNILSEIAPPQKELASTPPPKKAVMPPPPPPQKTLEDEAFRNYLAQLQGDTEAQEALLQKIQNKPKQFNLLPLLNLVDSETGSKLAQGYRQPQSAEEDLLTEAKIGELIRGGKKDIAELELKKLTGGNKDEMALARLAILAGTQKRLGEQYEDTFTKNITDKSLSDDVIKTQNKMLYSAKTAREALAKKNPIADGSLVNFLARASGEVGALTENDKAPFKGSQAWPEKIQQAINTIKEGKFTDENRALISDLLNVFETVSRRNIDERRQELLYQYEASGRVPEKVLKKAIGIKDEEVPKEEVSGEVVVISPNGVKGTIPKSQLEQALKEGYRKE